MIYGYARVSTEAQDLTGATAQLKAAGCQKIYREKVTGTTAERPQLKKLVAVLAHGDVVIVPAVDRLSRDTTDLLNIARDMQRAGAGIRSLAEPFLDTTSDFAEIVFAILGVAAKLEHRRIKERTARGRADATILGSAYFGNNWSAVRWRRTDYIYFGLTMLGAAVGFADFASNTWNREAQNVRIARTGLFIRLTNAASWINASCERVQRGKQVSHEIEENRRTGVVKPPDNTAFDPEEIATLYRDILIDPETGNQNRWKGKFADENFIARDCQVAKAISNALIGNDKIEALDYDFDRFGGNNKMGTPELGTFGEPSSWNRSILLDPVLQQPESLSATAKQMIYTPVTEIVSANEKIIHLESDTDALSFIGLFKHLSPILFGLGLGIRIARVHYEVGVEKRKAQPAGKPSQCAYSPPPRHPQNHRTP